MIRLVYMAERRDGTYTRASRTNVLERARKGLLVFEGVDGYEATDTVTYWYRRRNQHDEG